LHVVQKRDGFGDKILRFDQLLFNLKVAFVKYSKLNILIIDVLAVLQKSLQVLVQSSAQYIQT
jgi:hypothetical protein